MRFTTPAIVVALRERLARLRGRGRRRPLRDELRDIARRCEAGFLLNRPFVDICRRCIESQPGILQKHTPRRALRRQNQRLFTAPDGHSCIRCRWRSASNFMIAAAVSSIERRVTSSKAQPYLADILRA